MEGSPSSPNWAPALVRRNFRIDLFSAIGGGAYVALLVTFIPVVVRRLGGAPPDVAIVVPAPVVGRPLSPLFSYPLSGVPLVRVLAGAVTIPPATFLVGV